jgi:hypothetical protein
MRLTSLQLASAGSIASSRLAQGHGSIVEQIDDDADHRIQRVDVARWSTGTV